MEQVMHLLEGKAALNGVASLFANWDETLIWTALQGIMGQVWTVGESGAVALCQTGDFVFPAGNAHSTKARQLLSGLKEQLENRFAIITPQNEEWSQLIQQVFGEKVKAGERYAICKDPEAFDRAHLAQLAATLPEGVTLAPIAGSL